ncbi:hypothetical protein [Cylindrospermopsis raciborskii]|uniref:hypothetical protein n=1 Tax=Cylindrospermopsis raciborskii TaxID=77022 RepID=UPI001141EC73|nr:hypothetical protein [Cylindrospermopsis raciborskii]TPX28788.1 hypothetical protein FIV49_11720 [Cylindrospermopsis raciborskii GIHE 2018]
MSNPAFRLIGLDALRNDPRYANIIDGNAPDRNSDGQPDQRLTVFVVLQCKQIIKLTPHSLEMLP